MRSSTGCQMGVPHSSHFRWTMYRSVPGGLHDAGPNPQPTLPQRIHFCSSSSSLLRTHCFWPRLRCTELGRILFPSFSPGTLSIKALARYSVARPPPFRGPWLCAPVSRRGCPSRSASKEDAPTNFYYPLLGYLTPTY